MNFEFYIVLLFTGMDDNLSRRVFIEFFKLDENKQYRDKFVAYYYTNTINIKNYS